MPCDSVAKTETLQKPVGHKRFLMHWHWVKSNGAELGRLDLVIAEFVRGIVFTFVLKILRSLVFILRLL